MRIFLGYLLTFGWVFLVLGIAAGAKKLLHASDETGRKIVHCLVAFAWIPMILFLRGTWHIIIPPLCFIILNYISVKKDTFSMMERHDGGKPSYGTVYYAVSLTIMSFCTLFWESAVLPSGCAMFCMALGDGLAPFFGKIKKGNHKLLHGRTLYGSLCVFIISFLIEIFFIFVLNMSLTLPEAVLTAVLAAVLELVGTSGLDNLLLPLGVFVLNIILS